MVFYINIYTNIWNTEIILAKWSEKIQKPLNISR